MNVKYSYQEDLTSLIQGRSVLSFITGEGFGLFILSDGSRFLLKPNGGRERCRSGFYRLLAVQDCPSPPTAVEVKVESVSPLSDFPYRRPETVKQYTVTALTASGTVKLALLEGEDGSGMGGTGFHLEVAS